MEFYTQIVLHCHREQKVIQHRRYLSYKSVYCVSLHRFEVVAKNALQLSVVMTEH